MAVGSTPVAPGDQFAISGKLGVNFTDNGAATSFNCILDAGALTWTVPSPVPSAPAGGTLSLTVQVPLNLAPGSATCTDGFTESPVNLTTNGSSWTLQLTVPTSTSPSPSAGPFASTLTIPANTVAVQLTGWPGTDPQGDCTVTGPTTPFGSAWTYSAGTGQLGLSPADQLFQVSNALCPLYGANKLHSGLLTLTKVGTAAHPDLTYVP